MHILSILLKIINYYSSLKEVNMSEVLKKKSPRAPSMPLDEAISRAVKIYERERLHPAPTEIVAQHMGYKGANNGTSLSALASLRYYGLLDRPKEGLLAVSKDVETYLFAPDETIKRSLLVSFFKRPALYNDLLEKFNSGLPSDANLKFELIQKGFAPQPAEGALSVFKKSLNFVDYFNADRDVNAEVEIEDEVDEGLQKNDWVQPNFPLTKDAPLLAIQNRGDEDLDGDRIPVRLPNGRRAWLIIPMPFYEADKARLKAQIDLLLTDEEL
ncbi:MAG: hypothetical protein WBP13_07585 [Methylophilaceae bacterium]